MEFLAILSEGFFLTIFLKVTSKIQKILESKGKFNTQVDSLVVMLDQLLDEKGKLLKNISDEKVTEAVSPVDGSGIPFSGGLGSDEIQKLIQNARDRRLKEIDTIIEQIKDKFNECTGSVDNIKPKKRKPVSSDENSPENSSSSSVSSSNSSTSGNEDEDEMMTVDELTVALNKV